MPIFTLNLDAHKYDIAKSYQESRVIEETLTVRNAFVNESGAFVCITGHLASVQYNVFYIEVAKSDCDQKRLKINSKADGLSAYLLASPFHLVLASLSALTLIALLLFGGVVLVRRALRPSKYDEYTDANNSELP